MKYFKLLFLALLPVSAHSSCVENKPDWLWNYEGNIGNTYQVGMSLIFSGEEVNGLYFYKSQLKDITLKGRIIHGTDITLDELDASGNVTARFEGKFLERDPKGKFDSDKLACEIIAGYWHKLNSPSITVYLSLGSGTSGSLSHRYAEAGASDDNLIHKSAYRFWDAVKRGNREIVAESIQYPITLQIPNVKKVIRNSTQLIANYDDIFSSQYRDAILSGVPHNMFVNYQGIMLGDGKVWFGADGKVIALNNK